MWIDKPFEKYKSVKVSGMHLLGLQTENSDCFLACTKI